MGPQRLEGQYPALGAVTAASAALAPIMASPRLARRFVALVLDAARASEVVDLVSLLTSELVTNGVIHARSDIEIVITVHADAVRVEVEDLWPSLHPAGEPGEERDGGLGLVLVARLAGSWGVSVAGDRKTVWFEVARPRGERPSDGPAF
jgi:anti-sigma regulatory factor (Ser/Thr protein kinase)